MKVFVAYVVFVLCAHNTAAQIVSEAVAGIYWTATLAINIGSSQNPQPTREPLQVFGSYTGANYWYNNAQKQTATSLIGSHGVADYGLWTFTEGGSNYLPTGSTSSNRYDNTAELSVVVPCLYIYNMVYGGLPFLFAVHIASQHGI